MIKTRVVCGCAERDKKSESLASGVPSRGSAGGAVLFRFADHKHVCSWLSGQQSQEGGIFLFDYTLKPRDTVQNYFPPFSSSWDFCIVPWGTQPVKSSTSPCLLCTCLFLSCPYSNLAPPQKAFLLWTSFKGWLCSLGLSSCVFEGP